MTTRQRQSHPSQSREDAQHPTKSLLCFFCNASGIPIAGGVLYPLRLQRVKGHLAKIISMIEQEARVWR
jgi:hypothetical protein